jgi:hypothetical protein
MQNGVSLIWNRFKCRPSDRVMVNGNSKPFYQAMLEAISEAQGMATMLARKSIEDVMGMSVSVECPTAEWAQTVLAHGQRWNCAQGWTEKMMKQLVDNVAGSKIQAIKSWQKFAKTDDQKIALQKMLETCEAAETKVIRKSKKAAAQGASATSMLSMNWLFAN